MRSETDEKVKFMVSTLQDLKDKLNLISLPKSWLVWFRDESNFTFAFAKMVDMKISSAVHLNINAYLSTSAFSIARNISVSVNAINDIRQNESVLHELTLKYEFGSETSKSSHIAQDLDNIKETINDILQNNEGVSDNSDLSSLQFILRQLENACIPKNRRRYNIITQNMAIKGPK